MFSLTGYRFILFSVVMGLLCMSVDAQAQDSRARRQRRVLGASEQAQQDTKNESQADFVELLKQPPLQEVHLERNLFRPLIGPGSLREEIAKAKEAEKKAQEKEIDEEVLVPITTPEALRLFLVGTIISDKNVAYVRSPEDDFVLHVGDSVDTMTVQAIKAGKIIFLLENGKTVILSNIENFEEENNDD